jgi:histidyl-tRNA synthetase
MAQTAPSSGMRDFLPGDLARRRYVEGVIRQVFESYGFVAIETPAIENLTTLLGKYGDEGDQLLYRLLHRRDKLARALEQPETTEKDLAELGLRYDLTVPLARFIANSRDLPRFFKRYQIQPVWRADRPGKGRFREFYQCDVDITGTKSLVAEAEVCAAVAEVIRALGFTDFTIHLNHRQLLKQLIAAAGIAADKEGTALVAVDKMDKIGEDGVLKELAERGIDEAAAKKLLALLKRGDAADEFQELDRLAQLLAETPEAAIPLTELRQFLSLVQNSFVWEHLRVDTTLARGLGYYTGPIFEIRAADIKGSLGGGGRYDQLIGMFSGREIPAVGFSIGFERLVLLMEERKLFPEVRVGPQVLVCRFPEIPASECLRIAHLLRQSGLKTEVFPEESKLGKQVGYAETIGAPVVAILGGNELAAGTISLKKLASGEQETVPLTAAAEKIHSWLATP